MQKRSIESIGRVNVYYHLSCQENADNSGDNENTHSYHFMEVNQVCNPVHCH